MKYVLNVIAKRNLKNVVVNKQTNETKNFIIK